MEKYDLESSAYRPRTTRDSFTVLIFVIYATLWLSLATYATVANSTSGATTFATWTLIVAILLHFLAVSSSKVSDSVLLFISMVAIIAPFIILLFHRSASPQLYLLYLTANATIAAFVVDMHASEDSVMPRWLAGLQVAYFVILGLDSVTRLRPDYPMDDLKILTSLHQIADVRIVLFIPIAVAWLVIAIYRSRRDGSIDDIPIVWRTDITLLFAIIQVPGRFAAAVATFLAIILRRIGRDFLYEFRLHAQYLFKYIITIVAVGGMFVGAQEFAPALVAYIRTPTAIDSLSIKVLSIPVIGFVSFLLVPFINTGFVKLWLSQLSFSRRLQRAYQLAVIAAVPCTVIGPLFWMGARWLDWVGFKEFGFFSIVVLVSVVFALLFGSRLRPADVMSGAEEYETSYEVDIDWRDGMPILIAGGVVMAACLAWHLERVFRTAADVQLHSGKPFQGQVMEDKWRYFWIDIPAGTDSFAASLGTTNTMDLYSSFLEKPKSTSYTCLKRFVTGGEVTCSHRSPKPGRWWIGTYSSTESQFTLRVMTTFKIEGSAGGGYVDVHAKGAGRSFMATSDASGNYRLSGLEEGEYALTPGKVECRFAPTVRRIRVGPNTISNFRAYCPYSDLFDKQSVNGQVTKGNVVYYRIDVPTNASSLEIILSASSDLDLYARSVSKPIVSGGKVNECSLTTPSSREVCHIEGAKPGVWWIGVHGFKSGSYNLRAEVKS